MRWASAIFYGFDDIKGSTGDLIRSNPIAILVEAARKALINGEVTQLDSVLIIALVTLILFLLGRRFFNKNITKVAEYF